MHKLVLSSIQIKRWWPRLRLILLLFYLLIFILSRVFYSYIFSCRVVIRLHISIKWWEISTRIDSILIFILEISHEFSYIFYYIFFCLVTYNQPIWDDLFFIIIKGESYRNEYQRNYDSHSNTRYWNYENSHIISWFFVLTFLHI